MAQAGELAEFHYPGSNLIFCGELGEGIVERKEPIVWIAGRDVGEFDSFELASVFFSAFPAGDIYQDTAHSFCGSGEEVAAVLPTALVGRANQPKVRFMDEGGGLKCLAGGFSCHPHGRELSQLVVDEGEEVCGGLAITGRGGIEEASQFGHAVERNRGGDGGQLESD